MPHTHLHVLKVNHLMISNDTGSKLTPDPKVHRDCIYHEGLLNCSYQMPASKGHKISPKSTNTSQSLKTG